ncbi:MULTISPECIES: TIGR01777 family oxidoreductase [unclassified Lentimonas]|uniref:TIGR01777 family oxidoreductase n=1 Tax=unclassified Lentimonas TaxID=2630993 RepID=UPI0013277323|nr:MULTISPECIES: TIGR01777 family oxidoreductase [unclassified Lentimonas]CAA6677400.1 Cell division inhibitor [Lentimonas sp. CC4]CAA6686945.1 Cell division inhibitor [Lentimonas sp. CC6]CAA7074646.1 Cell division inhibitor [Lentimonas sp. CC4]CAA7169267.1 Cell division inhibitor [Lentimonas sp. CC21]CAA7180337.1 Cell division inhibitor [Lentimonas sp. CC8]
MKTSKTILVTGATGLVGGALCVELRRRGHSVRTLSRSRGDFHWDVAAGELEAGAVEGVDAVVHLAGEPVAQRWTKDRRDRILRSRVESAQLLVNAILQQPQRPDFICASGINYYGYKCGGPVDESSPSGEGFLAEVCRQWEGAAQRLVDAGGRTVFTRIGLVLSGEGGALAKMLPAFKLGLGGRLGLGTQLMSWIALPDLVQVLCRCVEDPSINGPVNAVAPEAVTNAEFTKALGRVLKRPTFCSVPCSVVNLLFSEMGRETLLANVGVVPARLQALGFEWEQPDLEACLRSCIK